MNPNTPQISSPLAGVLQGNPSSLDLSGGEQSQPQQTEPQQTTPSGGSSNTLMDFLLPTAGAVLGGFIPGLGETGISEAGGAAAGQALSDILQGRKPGGDVAVTGATSFILPKILGPLFSGIANKLGGAADVLQGIPSQDVFNGVVQKDPWMIPNAGKLASTAKELGYMDQPMAKSLTQMPQDFADIHSQILGAVNGNTTPVPLTQGLADTPSLLDNFKTHLENSNYSAGEPQFDSATTGITSRIAGLGDGNASVSDIYNEKARMSNLLANTFDKQARGGTLLPKEEANLAYFNALKDTMDQYGSPEIRALNTKQNHLYDIAKAFGTQYAKTAGKAAPRFGFGSLLPEGAGAYIASSVGANPILGGAAVLGGQLLGNSSTALNAGANVAGALANPSVLAGAGAGGAGLLNGFLNPQSATSPSNGGGQANPSSPQDQNNSQNNNQSTLPSFLGGGTQQSSSSSNGSVTQFSNGIQRDSSGNFILPDLNSVQTTIPGQIYPPDLQQQDLAKVAHLPFYMQDQALGQIRQKAELNTQITNQFLSTHQLSSDQVDLMKQIPQSNQSMNLLRSLIQTESGKNLFTAMINDSPAVQQVKANTDPQYAQMLGLMQTLRSTSVKTQIGGRVSGYELQLLNNVPKPGDTAKSALAKLDLIQAITANQYSQLLPEYGYTLQAASSPQQAQTIPGANSTSNPATLMNMLGGQSQGGQTPTVPTTGGIPSSLFNILGLGQVPQQ